MIFAMTLEMKETLAIGRKLPGSVGSSPARLMTGTRIDLFWSNGMTPSTMDRLQIVVRGGSKMSRCSCRRNVGKGSSSHDFGAAGMMMRRRSAGGVAMEWGGIGRRGNDDGPQFSRGNSRHSRQDTGRGWKRRRRRAGGVVSD